MYNINLDMLCLKRITFANVYDIYLVINILTKVVLHGLGFALAAVERCSDLTHPWD